MRPISKNCLMMSLRKTPASSISRTQGRICSRAKRRTVGKLRRGQYQVTGSLLGAAQRGKERLPMNGKYVGYVAGHDPLNDFLSKIIRDLMDVREPRPAVPIGRA